MIMIMMNSYSFIMYELYEKATDVGMKNYETLKMTQMPYILKKRNIKEI